MTATRTAIFFGLSLFWAAALHAQGGNCSRTIPVQFNDSGQTVERLSSPGCANLIVNAAHYAVGPQVVVPPYIAVPFQDVPVGPHPPGLHAAFERYQNLVRDIEVAMANQENVNRVEERNVEEYLSELNNLITQSDEQLSTGGPNGVIAFLQRSAFFTGRSRQETFGLTTWRSLGSIAVALGQIRDGVNALPLDFAQDSPQIVDPCGPGHIDALNWSAWYNCEGTPYESLKSEIESDIVLANQWIPGSENESLFQDNAGLLVFFNSRITGLQAPQFVVPNETVTCGSSASNQAISLSVLDLTSLADRTFVKKDAEITVVAHCPPPFAISVGAAFDIRRDRQFGIVQSQPMAGATMSVNEFGQTSSSIINPYPILMAHVRLPAWSKSNQFGLYGSFGAGASIHNQASGGSSAEFLMGLSLSLHRWVFITGGLDIVRESSLAGGFTVGGMVPSDVTTVPVSSSYEAAFGLAITFRIH